MLSLTALPLILALAAPALAQQQPQGRQTQDQPPQSQPAQPQQQGQQLPAQQQQPAQPATRDGSGDTAAAPMVVEVTPTAPGAPDGQQAGAAGPGFRVEIRGLPDEVDPEAFGRAVLAALPEQLLDPRQNFTRAENFQRDQDHRLLMVFHGTGDEPPLAQLCAQPEKADAIAQAQPPRFQELTSTTRIAAAFCRGEDTLSTATDQVTGEVTPEQASFRFLVADVAKQLFPSGFAAVPGTPTALTAMPPG